MDASFKLKIYYILLCFLIFLALFLFRQVFPLPYCPPDGANGSYYGCVINISDSGR